MVNENTAKKIRKESKTFIFDSGEIFQVELLGMKEQLRDDLLKYMEINNDAGDISCIGNIQFYVTEKINKKFNY
mgnify:CR=1 FL=1